MKRVFDLVMVVPGLLVLAPVMLLTALWIKCDSPGKVFFRQTRVGYGGQPFQVIKFRTMAEKPETPGIKLTSGDDPRITRAGKWLRKYKIDELPQLINVLKGEMSLVGPRPEVPEFVELYSEEQKRLIFSVLPGITDRASIEFRHENDLLQHAADPVQTYREKILPVKLQYYTEYVQNRSLWLDVRLIGKTIWSIVIK